MFVLIVSFKIPLSVPLFDIQGKILRIKRGDLKVASVQSKSVELGKGKDPRNLLPE